MPGTWCARETWVVTDSGCDLPAGIMLTVPTDFLASNYRTALAVPTVLSFLWSHVLVLDLRESPRYLLSKGLVGQCMAELAAIARKNGRPLPASATIVDTAAGEKDPDHTRSYGLMDLWKHPRLRALTVREISLHGPYTGPVARKDRPTLHAHAHAGPCAKSAFSYAQEPDASYVKEP